MFLVPQCRQSGGEPVAAISGAHSGPVSRPLSKGGTSGSGQARQYGGRLTISGRDNPGDKPAVLSNVDRLAVPYPR